MKRIKAAIISPTIFVAVMLLWQWQLVNAQNSTLGNNLMNQLKLAQNKVATEFPQKTDTQKIIDLLTWMLII